MINKTKINNILNFKHILIHEYIPVYKLAILLFISFNLPKTIRQQKMTYVIYDSIDVDVIG